MERATISDFRIQQPEQNLSLEIAFDPRLTVLAGPNGCGKTRTLNALVEQFNFALHRLFSEPFSFGFVPPGIRAKDERAYLGEYMRERIEKSSELLTFRVGDYLLHVSPGGLVLRSALDSEPWYSVVEQTERSGELRARLSPTTAKIVYLTAFRSHSVPPYFGRMSKWIQEHDKLEAFAIRDRQDLSYKSPELEAIKAVGRRLPGFESAEVDGKSGDFKLFKQGVALTYQQLSGGERMFFDLGVGIAFELFGFFRTARLEDCPGIVLIDEIELHLHPTWQRKMIDFLLETFPACQFILTTHSPQVLGQVPAHQVRLMTPRYDGTTEVTTPPETFGWDSNYILETIMNGDERDPTLGGKIDSFDDLLDDEKLDEAKAVLDELERKIEGLPPVLSAMRVRLDRHKRTRDAGIE